MCDRLGMSTELPDHLTPVGRLASVSLDTTDPATLADFYAGLLGMRRIYEHPDGSVIAISDGSIAITAMLAADHVRPAGRSRASSSNCTWTSP